MLVVQSIGIKQTIRAWSCCIRPLHHKQTVQFTKNREGTGGKTPAISEVMQNNSSSRVAVSWHCEGTAQIFQAAGWTWPPAHHPLLYNYRVGKVVCFRWENMLCCCCFYRKSKNIIIMHNLCRSEFIQAVELNGRQILRYIKFSLYIITTRCQGVYIFLFSFSLT